MMIFAKKFFLLIFVLGALPAFAPRPDAPTYAQRGAYTVGWQSFTLEDDERPLKLAVWYPAQPAEEVITYQDGLVALAGQAVENGAPLLDEAPYPLIIFSHGSGGTRFQSLFYTEHLASHGFVVISLDHPGNTIQDRIGDPALFAQNMLVNLALRPLDVLRVIEFADALAAPEDALAGVLDMDKIAVTGHSFGGYTALAVAGGQLDLGALETTCQTNPDVPFCSNDLPSLVADLRGLEAPPANGIFPPTTDPRIRAMVLLAPATGVLFNTESVGAIQLPTLTIVGSADAVTPPASNATVTYEQLGSPVNLLAMLENAGHYIFLENCPELAIAFGLFDQCSDDVWDMARAHDLTNHLATAFFLATLKEDDIARQALLPANVDFIGVEYQAKVQ